ncbi:M20/M25/M40 family metallo-hydrolase [Anoxynatronum buryatiense]|uniref:Selenium metabolism hydrolase n=1 Tax=Anoxynatronum buryatiense TaxID=489973 RepID=A0AA45WTW2_9CLOT|nr:M20/M25/M40 family metallo-hydrolase [Anoxynatronum buryatiense]SMP43764.1 putative selenium metabolism hydrolase [Anoxynatronum buryatiense]
MENVQLKLQAYAEELKPQTMDFCQRLLRIPALPGEEKELADLYLKEMEKLGYDEVFRDDWGNVVGLIKGTEEGPTIMFNSHLDHVDPGDYSEWGGYDPYGGAIDVTEVVNQDEMDTEMAEVIHGRGAADVKGGAACQVYAGSALLKLRKEGMPLKGTFMFSCVVLEEPAEQLGMKMLIDETLPEKGLEYHGVVSSEATSLKLILGHRGRVEMKVTIYGVTSHGSAPWLGVNAVNKSTRFIDRVEEVVRKNAQTDPDLGRSSIALTIINCTPGALCIVPDRAHITYDRRFVPGESAESCVKEIQELLDEMAAEDPDFKGTVEIAAVPRESYTGKTATMANTKEAWKIEQSHPFVQATAKALEGLGQPVKYGYWNFGTDLSVVCGRDKKPAIGYSPMQELYVHRPMDMVRTDYMEKALAGYTGIFLELSQLPVEDFTL